MNLCHKTLRTAFLILFAAYLAAVPAALAQTPGQDTGQLPAAAAETAAKMTATGVPSEDALKLARALHASGFEAVQIERAQAIVIEVRKQGLPVRPVIHKALEGMAKRIPPERILSAMEAVKLRYAFAFEEARSLSPQKDQVETLGNLLAESLAAGLEASDASRLVDRLKALSGSAAPGRKDPAAACLAMLRDMTRLGIGSELSTRVALEALARGLDAQEIAGLHQSLLSRAQSQPAQEVARGFAQAMQKGETPHGATSPGQSGAAGSGGAAGPGTPGGGGGAGGGPGGPGGGGPGGGPGGGGGNR
jgi:hypothetical protein